MEGYDHLNNLKVTQITTPHITSITNFILCDDEVIQVIGLTRY